VALVVEGKKSISSGQFAWAVGSLCALHKKPFDSQLLLSRFPPPYSDASLLEAIRAMGLKAKAVHSAINRLSMCPTPFLAWVNPTEPEPFQSPSVEPEMLRGGGRRQRLRFNRQS
jgi:ATP-binding cassette, subfamily B, bacterial HlyB/CyaB